MVRNLKSAERGLALGFGSAERGLALGFGVEPTWFSRSLLARVLDDSANRKSGRPSAGVDVERLGLTFRVADFFIAGRSLGGQPGHRPGLHFEEAERGQAVNASPIVASCPLAPDFPDAAGRSGSPSLPARTDYDDAVRGEKAAC